MISIEDFQQIRSNEHLVVLDTNVLLELYRQPANISLDVINALKKFKIESIYQDRFMMNTFGETAEKVTAGT
jgi:hypothetical protein